MKNYISFLVVVFLSFSAVAQKDTIATKRSVIALDKVKVVYRGIVNPLSIAVSNCKSFTVSGLGVQKNDKGEYYITPGQGLEAKITVTIENFDESISIEEHTFKIQNVPLIMAKINDQNCKNCIIELSKEEIKNAIISVGFNDFIIDLDPEYFQVKEFIVYIYGTREIKNIGNKFSEESIKAINKLKKGTDFLILNVRYPNPSNSFRRDPEYIKIMIKE